MRPADWPTTTIGGPPAASGGLGGSIWPGWGPWQAAGRPDGATGARA
jgi:hypothetical protein